MIQMCTDHFNLKQEYVWIFNNIIIKEKNWNVSVDADKDFDDSMYINKNESENKTHLIHENDVLNFCSITFWQHLTMSHRLAVGPGWELLSHQGLVPSHPGPGLAWDRELPSHRDLVPSRSHEKKFGPIPSRSRAKNASIL